MTPRTDYRYKVTGIWGTMKGRVAKDDVIIVPSYMGRSHEWQVVNGRTGKIAGGFKGSYLNKNIRDAEVGYTYSAPDGQRVHGICAKEPAVNYLAANGRTHRTGQAPMAQYQLGMNAIIETE